MSRIQQMPDDIKQQIDKMLRDRVPQTEILRRLAQPLQEAGEAPLSAAGLNRYSSKMEQVGRRIRETREVAAAWTARLGEEPTSEISRQVIEMLRTFAFEIALRADGGEGEEDDEPPMSIGQLKDLALGVQRLERAAETSLKREQDLRRAFEKEAAQELAAEAKKQGLSADVTAALRAALGTTA